MAVVRVDCKLLRNNPRCPHGPTLKFVRIQNGVEQEFYACSTYRDRKDCGFYLAAGEQQSAQARQVWAHERQRVLPSVDHAALQLRLVEVKQAAPKDRLFCHSCCQLDLTSRRGQHSSHDVQTNISDFMLSHPSQILKPREGSKKEAQYLFSAPTTQVIVDNLERADVSRVLCLGAPRVHEHVQATLRNTDSLLLDIDHRHYVFWSHEKFIWYNMFNRHIMSEKRQVAKRALRRFVAASNGGRVALVLDPPFGGHVEPLAAAVRYFSRLVAASGHGEELLVIWVFPYFRERHIIERCPSLTMLDYKVQYDNHKDFNDRAEGRKLGSPVRLFTNMDATSFVLPNREGYRLCTICARWVAPENQHCAECNSCPSKDGRTYVHCEHCGICVKPHWQHCVTCQRCTPSPHHCLPTADFPQDESIMEPRHKRMKTLLKKRKPRTGQNIQKKGRKTEKIT